MFLVDDSILIVFIDYGNSESKAVNEIYPLQESLTRLPAMAVACTLADVSFILNVHLIFILFISFVVISEQSKLLDTRRN